jgi:hypothetical protein
LLHVEQRPFRIAAIDVDAAPLAVMNADLIVLRTSFEGLLIDPDEAVRRNAKLVLKGSGINDENKPLQVGTREPR